jgi:hypothetical protein
VEAVPLVLVTTLKYRSFFMESSQSIIFVSGNVLSRFAELSVIGGATLPLMDLYRRTRGIEDEKKFPLRYTSVEIV